MKATKPTAQQWAECRKEPIFEIEVENRATGETDYVIFNIKYQHSDEPDEPDCFTAYHEPLTFEQKESDRKAFICSNVDEDFSLDSNLEALYELCQTAILESDFYTLK